MSYGQRARTRPGRRSGRSIALAAIARRLRDRARSSGPGEASASGVRAMRGGPLLLAAALLALLVLSAPAAAGACRHHGCAAAAPAQTAGDHAHTSSDTAKRSVQGSHGRRHAARRVLVGDGIGRARFGERRATVTHRIDALLGRRPSKGYHHSHRGGGVENEIRWQRLHAYFARGRFVGYEYWGRSHAKREPVLATRKGLRVGDTVSAGRHLYGSAFTITPQQGGAWLLRTPRGRLSGYASAVTSPRGKILTIGAGHLGSAALTP